MNSKIKIAVIGSGISGLSCSWLLSKKYKVDLYEKNDYFGGHSNTKSILTRLDNKRISVDTGFIVYNNKNYPNLSMFFEQLKVDSFSSNMSFSVSVNNGNFEYGGENLSTLFSQRLNVLNPYFWRMIFDILKFNRKSILDLEKIKDDGLTIDKYLKINKYSNYYIYRHLYPMAASIWSSPIDKIKNYPFKKFIIFFKNHGLLSINNRPQWKTLKNGSRSYVKKIINNPKISSFLNEKVYSLERKNTKIFLKSKKRNEIYDHVILASHANDNLEYLKKPTKFEKSCLSKIKYQKNIAYLHSDEKFMPTSRKVWSSWNYMQDEKDYSKIYVTYWMNKLQDLKTNEQIFVSLNLPNEPNKSKLFAKIEYFHPIFNKQTIEAQEAIKSIQGKNNTWFCGAYLGNGFHEDGIESGLHVAERILGFNRPWKR